MQPLHAHLLQHVPNPRGCVGQKKFWLPWQQISADCAIMATKTLDEFGLLKLRTSSRPAGKSQIKRKTAESVDITANTGRFLSVSGSDKFKLLCWVHLTSLHYDY